MNHDGTGDSIQGNMTHAIQRACPAGGVANPDYLRVNRNRRPGGDQRTAEPARAGRIARLSAGRTGGQVPARKTVVVVLDGVGGGRLLPAAPAG
jgi:hypothetical protein